MGARWRNGLACCLLVVATLALPLAGPSAGAARGPGMVPVAPGNRAMWLWSDAPAGAVVDWATAHGVREVFAYVGNDVATSGQLPRLRELKRRADLAGVRLTALGGEPSWAGDHHSALAWQRAVVATGLFVGLHVDVEPYLLPGWDTDRATIVAGYLRLLERLRDGSRLPVEADVPFWFGELTTVDGRNLATETLRRVAAVTVMAYRDTATGPNSLYDVSRDWLSRGTVAGKRVRLAAETAAVADCPYCTFFEEGATALGVVLAEVDAATRGEPAFGGLAVHHYDAWRALGA
ncbi:MAG TPA: hypothetical protein VF755_14810 [Catenuloplanes sp.]